MGDLTEDEIARIIRDVENGGRYIHGMMPEAAARAIVMAAAEANDALIQALEFYADNLIDGGSKARMALQLRATRKARRPDVDDQGGGK